MPLERKFVIKKSPIAGRGVFASRSIRQGETIHVLSGELCTLEEAIERVREGKEQASDPLGVDDERYLDLDETSRTYNHSCSPNAYVRGRSELVALRGISIGEEVTYDYSTTMNDNVKKIRKAGLEPWTCACNCGSEKCRGSIDQFKTLSKETQRFYITDKRMPDFMLKVFK